MSLFVSTDPYFHYSCQLQFVWQTSEAMFLIDLACVLHDAEEHYADIEEGLSEIPIENPASSG
jgi:hypothetical protein